MMIKLNEVSFSYGKKEILNSISTEFKENHIYGIVGANGAGKSTLLKCLGNIFYSNKGTITYNERNIIDNVEYIRELMFLDNDFFIGNENVYSLLKLLESSKGVKIDYNYLYKLIELFNFDYKKKIKQMSKGNQRLAYLITILSLRLKVIILDEYLDGIDLVNRRLIKNELLEYAIENNAIIIIASHTTSDISDICDHIILLKDQTIQRDCSIDDLKKSYITYQIVLKDDLTKDEIEDKGIEIYQYKSFENIRWISIQNTEKQIALINDIDNIDIKRTNSTLEEVIFNEFSD